jgi:phage shock protein A
MHEVDSLVADIQQALQDKKPPYMDKRYRLHPDSLLYRSLQVIEDLILEIRERDNELVELEEKFKDLEKVVDDLEDEIRDLVNKR